VNTIVAGGFDTPILDVTGREDAEGQIPFFANPRRLGKPDEFAALCAHIVENGFYNAATPRPRRRLPNPPMSGGAAQIAAWTRAVVMLESMPSRSRTDGLHPARNHRNGGAEKVPQDLDGQPQSRRLRDWVGAGFQPGPPCSGSASVHQMMTPRSSENAQVTVSPGDRGCASTRPDRSDG
jgi:hypothetical protein